MLEDNIICVYHEDCNDGFTAAYLVSRKFPNAKFYPAQYGKTQIPEATKNDVVLIVDFSFPPEQLKELGDRAKQVFVLDHHKTPIEKLEGWEHPNVELILDTSKAGCMLTWEYLYTPEEKRDGIPPMVLYSNDYDLWKFEYGEDTKAFVRYMYSLEKTFENWELYSSKRSNDINIKRAIETGKILLRDDEVKIQWHIENSTRIFRITEENIEVPVCNVPHYLVSAVNNKLSKDYFFAIGYSEGPGGRKLRFNCSQESDIDLSKLAGTLGGGGHARSAGAIVDINLPWETIIGTISKYLSDLED